MNYSRGQLLTYRDLSRHLLMSDGTAYTGNLPWHEPERTQLRLDAQVTLPDKQDQIQLWMWIGIFVDSDLFAGATNI